jgi:4-amino-4-deoxy-L-arabinose transferase-like glycosyltransferase
MKLRAFPGTFILAALLGFIPGTMLLGTAYKALWPQRGERLIRFLFAWIIGYIVYLELLSSKPGTYMVQTMFPAMALLVAMVVTREEREGRRPVWSGFALWPTALAALPLAIFGAIYVFTGDTPGPVPLLLIILVAAFFIWTGKIGREGRLRRWFEIAVGTMVVFSITLLGVVLPGIDKIWPARSLAEAIAGCAREEAVLIGYREPSSRFLLAMPSKQQTPDALATRASQQKPTLAIVEDRWAKRTNWSLQSKSLGTLPAPAGCVAGYNVMRGCPLHFRIYSPDPAKPCVMPARFACSDDARAAGFQKSGDCD